LAAELIWINGHGGDDSSELHSAESGVDSRFFAKRWPS